MEGAIELLLTYGPGGIIAVLLILGILVPKSTFDREVERGEAATEATKTTSAAMKEMSDANTKLASEIGELRKEISTGNTEIRNLREEVRILRSAAGE